MTQAPAVAMRRRGNRARLTSGRPWLSGAAMVVAVAGALLHFAGFLLTTSRSSSPEGRAVGGARPMSGGGSAGETWQSPRARAEWLALVEERADLQDSEPLILPTQWNARLSPVAGAGVPSALGLLKAYPPRTRLPELPPPRPMGDSPELRVKAPELLQWEPDWLRGALAVPPLPGPMLPTPPPGLRIRRITPGVTEAPSDSEVSKVAGDAEVAPEATLSELPILLGDFPAASGVLWNPTVWHWQVGGWALAGPPVMLQSSGQPALDAFLLGHLPTLPALQRLPPGLYEISVTP